jgi:hypothetical protein
MTEDNLHDLEAAFLLRVEHLRSTPEFRTEVDALSTEQLEQIVNALPAVPEWAISAIEATGPERRKGLEVSLKALIRAVAYSAELADRMKGRKTEN